ncbi:MAG: hypothetical protein OXC07_00430 [Kistimonas sp.]|nr:hypothetical protein [Kistimonas sp.]
MNNLSTNANDTYSLIQTGHGGGRVRRSRTQAVLQTAATLSVLGSRKAAPGGRSRRQAGSGGIPGVSRTSPVVRHLIGESKRSGVRVRESAGPCVRTQEKGGQRASAQTSTKAGRQGRRNKRERDRRQLRSVEKDAGCSSSPGSRRRQRRSEALDDFPVVRAGRSAPLSHQHRTRKSAQDDRDPDHPDLDPHGYWKQPLRTCTGPRRVRLEQDNFHRIHENLDGCYVQVGHVVLRGDQARDIFPVGNSTHPFTGWFYSTHSDLTVQLERSRGDAVLFGAVRDGEITLHMKNSSLVTHDGGRAALFGELQGNSQVGVSLLRNSLFNATGVGAVQAGLVGSVHGAGNFIRVHEILDNRVQAWAQATNDCQQTAVASLGLGLLRSNGRQDVYQDLVRGNQLQARAGSGWAAAAMLGVLDKPQGHRGHLWSFQRELHDNSVQAAAGEPQPSCPGGSRASLGYADVPGSLPALASPATRLYAKQADWVNNRVQAVLEGSQILAADNSSCVSQVATAAVEFLQLQQRGLAPGQLQGCTQGQSLLPATRVAKLFLFSGGNAELPLFPAEAGLPGNVTGFVDAASYQWRASNDTGTLESKDVRIGSSLQLAGWREAYETLRYSESLFPPLTRQFEHTCKESRGRGNAFHYPGERLQLMIPVNKQWLLLTRQRYPWQQDHDLKGVLRVTRYRGEGRVNNPRVGSETVLLYRPHAGDPQLLDVSAGYSLVQGHQLHLVYQKAGWSPQVVSLALNETDSDYRVRQYDELAGQARLLSEEDGDLHLWMQQEDKDILLVHGLGTSPMTTDSSNLTGSTNLTNLTNLTDIGIGVRWGFDLSEQPGGTALLARHGQWLYAVRQQQGQRASLRRWRVEDSVMDPDWQLSWPGRATADVRLVAAYGRLYALAADSIFSGLWIQIAAAGGCAHWQWRSFPPSRSLLPAEPAMPPTSWGPPIEVSFPRWRPTFPVQTILADEDPALSIWAGVCVGVSCCLGLIGCAGCLAFLAKQKRNQVWRMAMAQELSRPRWQEAGRLELRDVWPREGSAMPQEQPPEQDECAGSAGVHPVAASVRPQTPSPAPDDDASPQGSTAMEVEVEVHATAL